MKTTNACDYILYEKIFNFLFQMFSPELFHHQLFIDILHLYLCARQIKIPNIILNNFSFPHWNSYQIHNTKLDKYLENCHQRISPDDTRKIKSISWKIITVSPTENYSFIGTLVDNNAFLYVLYVYVRLRLHTYIRTSISNNIFYHFIYFITMCV